MREMRGRGEMGGRKSFRTAQIMIIRYCSCCLLDDVMFKNCFI